MYNAKQLRQDFRSYMTKEGYEQASPDSLISQTFPTSFTISGGHRNGRESLPTNFQVIQRCHRFWDVENVGDQTHLSHFEMCITNSLNGISREKMFRTHFAFLLDVLKLNPKYFTVSVFGGGTYNETVFEPDEESVRVFQDLGVTRFTKECGFVLNPTHGRYVNPNLIINLHESLSGYRTEIYYHDLEIWTSALHTHTLKLDSNENLFRFGPLAEYRAACGFGLERMLMAANGFDGIEKVFPSTKGSHRMFDHVRGLVCLYHDGAFELTGNINSGRRTLLNRYIMSLCEDLDIQKESILLSVIRDSIDVYSDELPELVGQEKCIEKVILDRANRIGCLS